MTAPRPVPLPTADWTNRPTWCDTCEVHQATATRPTCPVCLDIARLAKEAS